MKKKLLFKNSTQYSKKLYDDFTHFHNEKNSMSYEIFTVFILILLIYCIFATINARLVPLAITFIVVLVIFICYRLFVPIYTYKKESNKKSITKELTFKFYFYDTYFKVRDNLDYDKINYLKLYKVYETNNYFYLYLRKNYSFILDKKSFFLGTSEEFSSFIKNKIKFRYYDCSKKSAKK